MNACSIVEARCNTLETTARRPRAYRGVALLGILLLAFQATMAGAAIKYRTTSGGTWNDANWNTAGAPAATDTVYIGYTSGSGVATVTVDNISAVATNVYLGYNTATQAGTLVLTNNATLTVTYNGNSSAFYLGYYGGNSILSLAPGTMLSVTGGTFQVGTPTWTIDRPECLALKSIGTGTDTLAAPTTTITQVGGTLTVSGGSIVLGNSTGKVGVYVLTNGAVVNLTLATTQFLLGNGGVGVLQMAAGTAITSGYFGVSGGASGSSFTFRPSDASISVYELRLGNVRGSTEGTFVQDSGTWTVPIARIGNDTGSGAGDARGALCVSNGAVFTATTVLYVRASTNGAGRLYGWGTVEATSATAANGLNVNGRVIADGFGAEHDLVITNTLYVRRTSGGTAGGYGVTQPDGTLAGFYAVNRGRLKLVTPTIVSGTSVTNWGEVPTNTTIELVNSAQMAFTSVTGGKLQVNLLAPNRSDANVVRTNAVIGLWNFDTSGGFAFGAGSATVTFRYDSALAAQKGINEANLKVWKFDGSKWQDVTASVDTTAKTISTTALTSFFNFAVSEIIPIPPRGTIFVAH